MSVEVLRDGAQLTVQTRSAIGMAPLIGLPPMGEAHTVRLMRGEPAAGGASAGVMVTGSAKRAQEN